MIEVWEAVLQAIEGGERATLATVIDASATAAGVPGRRILVRADGSTVGTLGGGAGEAEVIARSRSLLDLAGGPERFRTTGGPGEPGDTRVTMEVFLEPVAAAPPLVVFGAGHVGRALTSVAAVAGFHPWVVDEREEFAQPGRLAGAFRVICADPLDVLDRLPWGPGACAVIVTHAHTLDEDLMHACLTRSCGYLGMIGSRRKVLRFHDRYLARGGRPEELARLRAPIGLDLGGREPGEIAVAITAEMIRWRRGWEAHAADPLAIKVHRSSDGTAPRVNPPPPGR